MTGALAMAGTTAHMLSVSIGAGTSITSSGGGQTFPPNTATVIGALGGASYSWTVTRTSTSGAFSFTGQGTPTVAVTASLGPFTGRTVTCTLQLVVRDGVGRIAGSNTVTYTWVSTG